MALTRKELNSLLSSNNAGATAGAKSWKEYNERQPAADDPDKQSDKRKKLLDITNKYLEEERKKADPGFWGFLTDQSWGERAQANARNRATSEITKDFKDEDWDEWKGVLGTFNDETAAILKKGSENQQRLIDTTNTTADVIRLLPGAGIGEWGANMIRQNTGQMTEDDLLSEQLGLSRQEIASMSIDEKRKYSATAQTMLGVGGGLDLLPGGALIKGAVKNPIKMTAKELAKQTIKEQLTKQGAKGLLVEAGAGAATTGAISGGVSLAMGNDLNQALKDGAQGLAPGALAGVFGRPVSVVTNKFKGVKPNADITSGENGKLSDERLSELNSRLGKETSKKINSIRGDKENTLKELDLEEKNLSNETYLRENNLMNTEAGQARYDEIMGDVTKLPGVMEASASLRQADAELARYNEIRVDMPFARQADSIESKIEKINMAKQKDLAQLERMLGDSDLEPAAIRDMMDEVELEYSGRVEAENAKLEELAVKDPEGAAEYQMLKESETNLLQQRNTVEEALMTTVRDQEQMARLEAQKIADTPNQEAISARKEAIAELRAESEASALKDEETIIQGAKDASARWKKQGKTAEDLAEEIQDMNDGIHPLSGTSKKKQDKHRADLHAQQTRQEADKIASRDPEVEPLTEADVDNAVPSVVSEALTAKGNLIGKMPAILQQPTSWLRNMGLNKLADSRTDSMINFNKLTADDTRQLRQWHTQSKGNSSEDLFKAADGSKSAYKKLNPAGQKTVDEYRAWVAAKGKELGLPDELTDNAYYIPHLFVGQTHKDKLVDIQLKMKDLIKKIDEDGLEESQVTRSVNQLKKYNKQIEDLMEPGSKETYKDFIKENGDITSRFLQERTDAKGYKQNFFKAVQAYSQQANSQIAFQGFTENAAQIINTKGVDNRIKSFLQTEINTMRNQKNDIDKSIDDYMNSLIGTDNIKNQAVQEFMKNSGTKIIRGQRMLTSLAMFAGNIGSGINTMAQAAFIPSAIGLDGAVVGALGAGSTLARLSTKKLTGLDTNKLKHYLDIGVFEGHSPVLTGLFDNKAVGGANVLADKVTKGLMAPLQGGDRLIRLIAAEGADYRANLMGLKGAEKDRFIYEKVIEAAQNFSSREAPHAFRSQVAKSLAQAVAWIPGMSIRTLEIARDTGKGWANLSKQVVGKANGKDVTGADVLKNLDDATRGLFFVASAIGVGSAIGQLTGQDEVVPNPFSKNFYQTPTMQFIFGTDTKTGLTGLFASDADKFEEVDGKLVNVDHEKRVDDFLGNTLPRFLVPGYAQYRKTMDGAKTNEQGYSETDNGGIRFMTDPANDTQRLIFGQYSSPEGQDYIKNMGMPGGGALSKDDSTKIKEAPLQLRQQYYDFFRSTDALTGRTEANKEVTQLFKDGKPEQARRKASEYNAKVDEKLYEFFNKYPNIDPSLQDNLRNNVRITLTERSEKSRAKGN